MRTAVEREPVAEHLTKAIEGDLQQLMDDLQELEGINERKLLKKPVKDGLLKQDEKKEPERPDTRRSTPP
jgi:hypothetical protein